MLRIILMVMANWRGGTSKCIRKVVGNSFHKINEKTKIYSLENGQIQRAWLQNWIGLLTEAFSFCYNCSDPGKWLSAVAVITGIHTSATPLDL